MKPAVATVQNCPYDPGPIWLEPGVEPWRDFLLRIQVAVAECNGIAGERIWEAVHTAAEPWRILIRSLPPRNSVAIDYDPVCRSLACRFRPAGRRDDLELTLSAVNAGESADSVLNALVFPQED